MKHAAIPTTYKGIRFRSRLEAKWACVFDQLGWNWEYEPIDLNGWIPDFLVTAPSPYRRPTLVEVKPVTHSQEDRPAIVKMEKALGAPPCAELRNGAPYPAFDEWDEFFRSRLKYDVLLLGAAPLRQMEYDHWIDETRFTGKIAIGWHFGDSGAGWDEAYLVPPKILVAAWTEATNAVQWRAP